MLNHPYKRTASISNASDPQFKMANLKKNPFQESDGVFFLIKKNPQSFFSCFIEVKDP